MSWTEEIEKPTLILDSAICRANIQRMAERAQRNHVAFRPHCKTHQSSVIGEWFREMGVDKITVSSVEMATYFAENGWKDIIIAFTVRHVPWGPYYVHLECSQRCQPR